MFYKEASEIDLGDVSIPNIFIDIFMPMADGIYVKVYLLGYKQACDKSANPHFDNNSIAKNLDIPLSDVLAAWKFWEDKHIIKIHKSDDLDKLNYSIEFLDIKKYYLKNIENKHQNLAETDVMIELSKNPSISNMFNTINKIIGRYLEVSEKKSLLESMNKYNMNPDMIVYAYKYVSETRGQTKSVKYINGILRSWYDANIYTEHDINESIQIKGERYKSYKEVLRQLGLFRQATVSEQKVMDEWLDKYKMTMDLILHACDRSKNIPNPSISYINGIIKNWIKSDIKNVSDLEKHEKERKTKESKSKHSSDSSYKPVVIKKTGFHNFNETFTQYSSDELNEIIKKSQKEKFK